MIHLKENKKNDLKEPIFLIGNVRSGTTMMQRLFSIHPEICIWLEPRAVWNYADPKRKIDRFDENDVTPKVRKYIRKRFLNYQRQHDDLRVMEKTPVNVLRIPYVHKIFPESKMVYIIRNPLSQLSSSEFKWQNVVDWKDRRWALYSIKQTPKTQLHLYAGKFFIELFKKKILKEKHPHIFGPKYEGIYEDRKILSTEQVIAKQWVMCSRQAESDMKNLPAGTILRIKYEDFVENPIYHFKNVLKHFDLSMPNYLEEKVKGFVDPSRQHKWKRFDDGVLKNILPILKEEMLKHGYSIPV